MRVEVYGSDQPTLEGIIFPQQTHSCNIQEVVLGSEDLSDCDGIWCMQESAFSLGIKTADCAPIAFWDETKYGILHAGWRGLMGGIVEEMLEVFEDPEIFVGPILPQFEIQRDFCYEAIYERFGDRYFLPLNKEDIGGLIFDFQAALKSIIPQAKFDPRITREEPSLASWRRDKNEKRNVMVIRGD